MKREGNQIHFEAEDWRLKERFMTFHQRRWALRTMMEALVDIEADAERELNHLFRELNQKCGIDTGKEKLNFYNLHADGTDAVILVKPVDQFSRVSRYADLDEHD